jgi:hypothetical protein
MDTELEKLYRRQYDLRLAIDRLWREVNAQPSPPDALWAELQAAEQDLSAVQQDLAARWAKEEGRGRVVDTTVSPPEHLGPETTGLAVEVVKGMEYVPTAIYHLFDKEENPLLRCKVCNRKAPTLENPKAILRVRVISFIDGYSAQAVETVELKQDACHPFNQLPTLYPDRVSDLDEMTRATLNLKVENLDGQVERHETQPIWLLARTTLPLKYWDPGEKVMRDTARYLGSFVTPNAPEVQQLLLEATELHPEKRLRGYQKEGGEDKDQVVESQVKALYQALSEHGTRYVHSGASFGPQQELVNHQRVRLPRESLKLKLANCFDGAVLFASLLEAIGMSAAIVLVPGHAFVAWETWSWYDKAAGEYKYSDEWKYLETTMIGREDFGQARGAAEVKYGKQQASANCLKLRVLRAQGITPME